MVDAPNTAVLRELSKVNDRLARIDVEHGAKLGSMDKKPDSMVGFLAKLVDISENQTKILERRLAPEPTVIGNRGS